ncbi:MAG: SUMF1/EgtB/PvdO family nonheme iron enzyme [Verrucomicrobia bacterium]|nr:SUMF1/EgtB/PvdO family nonheme iron enzyme [Verrucomicrobiota bacterium]
MIPRPRGTSRHFHHHFLSRFLLRLAGVLLFAASAQGQWLPVSRVTYAPEPTENGGEFLIIEYDLNVPDLSPQAPAYVFVRYSVDGGNQWLLVRPHQLRGESHDLVSKPGRQTIVWWGSDQLGLTAEGVDLKIAVRALRLVRIPGGSFQARFNPGGAFDTSKSRIEDANLPTFHLAKFETTVAMYADYLNEVGRNGRGWNRLMANPERCGIVREAGDKYTVVPGRENHPINYVSWYEAQAFLDWCGLRLPTELEFQKAVRGGLYLDGDASKQLKNPKPERRYPWGDESPEAGNLWRCNCDVADRNRAPQLAAVGSYPKFPSPYGIADLVGIVAEWTLDWYATTYHNGIDGYRMIRGGSYMDPPAGVDAIAGASQLPVKRGSITGFRAARGNGP